MIPFPKKRRNKICLSALEAYVLMKKVKKVLASIFLSFGCLMFSTAVLAGNGQSGVYRQISVDEISSRLNFIERKVLFESTKQLLNSLNLVFIVLKSAEPKLDIYQRALISKQFKNVLCKLRISSDEEARLFSGLSHNVNGIMFVPPTPRLKPEKFVGEISEWGWGASIGTESRFELVF